MIVTGRLALLVALGVVPLVLLSSAGVPAWVAAGVKGAGRVPFTIKVRKGIDDDLLTYLDAGRIAQEEGVPVILNPAPAQLLPVEWLSRVRFLTPNQHELATVLGAQGETDFRELMRRAPCPVVLTRGEDGAWFRDKDDEPRHQSGFKVDAVDSTGAGDTFNAALAVYLAEGLDVAVRKACATAAIAVSRLGAQGGMPRADEVTAFLETHQ